MESIFKSLSKEHNSVKNNPNEAVASKRELLEEIVEYVNSMEWLSRSKTKVDTTTKLFVMNLILHMRQQRTL